MGIVNISNMKCETEGEKNFTPVTKSSIFQKTEQTTTYHFPQILVPSRCGSKVFYTKKTTLWLHNVEIIRLFLSSQTLDFRKNTPAYAGNTSDPSSTIPVFRDHPRLRGEYAILISRLTARVGSPPLARGILHRTCYWMPTVGITPACAGNTCNCGCDALILEDHPRLRGEYNVGDIDLYKQEGSPPLARGILILRIIIMPPIRITPACAGNTQKKNSILLMM